MFLCEFKYIVMLFQKNILESICNHKIKTLKTNQYLRNHTKNLIYKQPLQKN